MLYKYQLAFWDPLDGFWSFLHRQRYLSFTSAFNLPHSSVLDWSHKSLQAICFRSLTIVGNDGRSKFLCNVSKAL